MRIHSKNLTAYNSPPEALKVRGNAGSVSMHEERDINGGLSYVETFFTLSGHEFISGDRSLYDSLPKGTVAAYLVTSHRHINFNEMRGIEITSSNYTNSYLVADEIFLPNLNIRITPSSSNQIYWVALIVFAILALLFIFAWKIW